MKKVCEMIEASQSEDYDYQTDSFPFLKTSTHLMTQFCNEK